MRFHLTSGTFCELSPIAWIRPKNLPDGNIELHVYPTEGGFHEEPEVSWCEVPVSIDEYLRCYRVAPHLFGLHTPACSAKTVAWAERYRAEWEAKQEAEREAEQATLATT